MMTVVVVVIIVVLVAVLVVVVVVVVVSRFIIYGNLFIHLGLHMWLMSNIAFMGCDCNLRWNIQTAS